MKNFLKNNKGLSTVVTTLIILVVSVLLATVVTFYTINITTNRTQQESLYMTKLHTWYNTTGGWAEAAFVLINTGGKDVVLDKVTARSQKSDWSNVYYWRTNTVTITADLNVTSDQPTGSSYSHLIQGASRTLEQATDVITLKSGWTIVIYVNHPDSVGQNDVGTPVEITVFTANAHWTQECNVEAAQ
jgi:hypothetical protein